MADDDQPRPPRRTPDAFQPIEALDEGASGPLPAAAVPPLPVPPPPDPPQAQPPQEPEPPTPTAVPVVPIAVRFSSAAAALAFAGQLLSIGRGEDLTFWSTGEHGRWVRAEAELDIARELAAAAHGVAFVEVAPGRLVEDHGWGDPPTTDTSAVSGAEIVASDSLSPATLAELVRVAGLHRVRERPVAAVHILLPGAMLAVVVRRALDLRLEVAHRPVRLRPLFPDEGHRDAATAQLELRVSAAEGGQLPVALLAALARDEQLTLCRAAGDRSNLLVQYGLATPVHDELLANLLGSQAWVLAGRPLGCQLFEPAGEFVDSVSCVRLADDYPLESATPPADDRAVVPELRIVAMRTYGRSVDAILLSDDDLDAVALLLEGHPLSDRAQLVRGRDRHLLLVPGGVLEHLPVGEALYCLGPGPLYLPLGYGTKPQLPVSARRALFTADDKTAVVLLPTMMLRFGVVERVPVWRLWAGPAPELDLQFPEGAAEVLAAVAVASAETEPAAERPAASDGSRTWLDQALEAEFRGELAFAAELHERHGDPVRAARLWARAADAGG